MKTEVLCSYTLSLMEVEQVVGKKTQNDHLLLSLLCENKNSKEKREWKYCT